MISSAFKSAYTNKVGQQNQGINTITGGIKDSATVVMGALGFSGALGEGMLADASKHVFANRVGGIGGNIMLASMEEKKSDQETNAKISSMVNKTPEVAQKNMVIDYLTNKGKIATNMGDVDPESELGKNIIQKLSEKEED